MVPRPRGGVVRSFIGELVSAFRCGASAPRWSSSKPILWLHHTARHAEKQMDDEAKGKGQLIPDTLSQNKHTCVFFEEKKNTKYICICKKKRRPLNFESLNDSIGWLIGWSKEKAILCWSWNPDASQEGTIGFVCLLPLPSSRWFAFRFVFVKQMHCWTHQLINQKKAIFCWVRNHNDS